MSIAGYIRDAREIVSGLLEEVEGSSTVPDAPYTFSSIKSRKWYWNCSKTSRILADLSSYDLPETTEEDLEKIRAMDSQTHQDPNQRWTEACRDPNSLRAVERPYRPVPTPVVNSTSYSSPPIRTKSTSTARLVNTNNVSDNDKLKMEGFAAVKAVVGQHNPTSRLRSEIPYISLGDLGMAEGWTNILTNAAYCYDNTPVEGWRREVSIRRSGKTKGGIDIHYVTPDKKRRFRSRQELQSYLNRISASVDFINKFDFRSVFCVCQQCEDHNRSYLECSYGFAGCNHWIHPECVGLGVRTEEELALMPRVICPYCAAYLEGTGEAAAIVKPDML